MKTKLGIFLTLLSALGYAATAVLVIKAYQGGATPWQVLLAQNTIAASLWPILLVIRRKQLKLLKKDLPVIIGAGLIGNITIVVCYTLSLRYIPGSVATLTFFTYPIFVALGTKLFFREALTKYKIMALLLAFSGVVLTSRVLEGNLGSTSLTGILLCLSGALGAAFLTIMAQKLVDRYNPLDMVLVQHLLAALAITVLISFSGLSAWSVVPGYVWFWGSLLVLCTSLLPSFLSLKGIAYLGAYKASIVATAEIPLTLLLVLAFLQETMSNTQWLGSGLILGSVIMMRKK